MNFQLFKIKKEPDIDIDSLLQGVKTGSAVGDSSEIKKIIKGIRTKNNRLCDFENFERKFRFRYLLRAFYNYLVTHGKRSSSVIQKNNSNLLLPNINNSNSVFESQNSNSFHRMKKIPTMKTIFKKNFERSKSNIFSQNVINNNNLKLIIGNIIDFNNSFHKKISNDAIFDVRKNEYIESLKNCKIKNKEARNCFKNELNDIKNEKINECAQNKLFKEFEMEVNPKKKVNCLRKKYDFYQKDNCKKNNERNTYLLLKEKYENNKLNNKKEKSYIKPSQKVIRNIVRKDKIFEFNEKSEAHLNI